MSLDTDREILLDDFVETEWYQKFIDKPLCEAIKRLKKSILRVDKGKNKIQYTEHDMNRIVLRELENIRSNIEDGLEHINRKYW